MKSKINFKMFIFLASFFVGCKEKELDSPYITILTPVANQVFQDKDSIRVEARIEPKNTSVVNSIITIKDKKGHVLAQSNLGCACENLPVITLKKALIYPVKQNQDVTLEICADLQNGVRICETRPFVIVK